MSDVWSRLLVMEVWPGQTTTGIFIIGSISKTNNNILLTGGQSQYYLTKKTGMSLVVLLGQTMRVMQAGQIGIDDEYLFTVWTMI